MLCEFAATVYGATKPKFGGRISLQDELKLAVQWKVFEPEWTTELPDGLDPVIPNVLMPTFSESPVDLALRMA